MIRECVFSCCLSYRRKLQYRKSGFMILLQILGEISIVFLSGLVSVSVDFVGSLEEYLVVRRMVNVATCSLL